MITLQKFIECSEQSTTGRVAYAIFPVTPPREYGKNWRRDSKFSIAQELSHDPHKVHFYRIALSAGYVVLREE